MSRLLCKLFRFLLNMFEQVVTVVASALKTIGTAAIDVLDDLLTTASNALGLPKLALFAGAGLLLWLFMASDDEDESSPQPRKQEPNNVSNIDKPRLA